MSTGGHDVVECSRCGSAVSIEEASMLNKKGSKGLWRYLCPDCLRSVGVPKGYELRRDLSFLQGAAPSADSADETASDVGDQTRGSSRDPEVIADFTGTLVTGGMPQEKLTAGRILMNRRQLVLATDECRTAIPLDSIRDVAVGRVTESTRDVFDDVVTLDYRSGNSDDVAFVSAEHTTLQRFTTILFKALLGGTAARYKHPVSVGGYVRESAVRSGVIGIRDDSVQISGSDHSVTVEVGRVIDVTTASREWHGEDAPVLAVRHLLDGMIVLSEFALPSKRSVNLLYRFIQVEFGPKKRAIGGLELSQVGLRFLTGLYTLGTTDDLSPLLGTDSTSLSTISAGLVEDGLVREEADGYSVTKKGRVLVHDRFEEIQDVA